MEIPSYLIDEVKRGNSVLFLGSQAFKNSKNNEGRDLLSDNELRDMLCDQFLGGEEKDLDLSSVFDITAAENDIQTVYDFIKTEYWNYRPNEKQIKLANYNWSSIYTTNYNLIIERIYSTSTNKKQRLVPIYKVSDRVDSLVKPPEDLAYIKLHGCITKISGNDRSLILSPDQYSNNKKEISVLLERLKEIGHNKTIFIIGKSLDDSDIKFLLKELDGMSDRRPRYYCLIEQFSDRQQRMWEAKRVHLISGTMEEFFSQLDYEISDIEREFHTTPKKHAVERFFVSNEFVLSDSAYRDLDNSLIFLHEQMPMEQNSSKLFYKGYSQGWSAIASKLDVRRRIADEIISEVILTDEVDRVKSFEMYNLSGSAGTGKTVLLKRLAWDSAIDYNKICFYFEASERIPLNTLNELAEKIDERIFLFIDRASLHVQDLIQLSNSFTKSSLKITCLVTERTNEWNVECGLLENILTDSFNVRDLSHNEIESLIFKLEENNSLGVLKYKNHEERMNEFVSRSNRQLLVALHEVTMGKPFKEIIQNEFDNIAPRKAQLMYRTICVMNQFNVPVRAGVIKRVHDISFDDFKNEFFEPLEKIVQVQDYSSSQDIAYTARHPTIANMVFVYSLHDELDRFETYLSILLSLDIGFSSDRTVFRELIKYRHLSEVFRSTEYIENIYLAIENVCGNDDYYFQQHAISYMRSPQPNYIKAENLLNKAEQYGSHNVTISHSRAELEFARAKYSQGLERERLLNKAEALSRNIHNGTSHGLDTRCKIALQRLEDSFLTEDTEVVTDAIKNAEEIISLALQIYPDDEVLLSEESRFATLINDNERSIKALEKAFSKNNANGHIAARLSSYYLSVGREDDAFKTLNAALKVNPTNKSVHAALAKIYSEKGNSYREDAEYHWQHSFTDGDRNSLNQLYYSRQLYLNGKFNEYNEQILKLKLIRVSPNTRHMLRGIIKTPDGDNVVYTGRIYKKEATYALIDTIGFNNAHYLHYSNCHESLWYELKVNDEVKYNLGFTFSGTAAILC